MARKMKDEAKARAGHNGFDPEVLRSVVDRIEGVHRGIESERGSYMAACKSLREDIANIYEEAKARGIPTKELKKAVKARDLTRKIDKLRDDLDDMIQRETYDQIRFALGDLADTPLGAAATAGAPGSPEEDKDIRPGFLRKDGLSEEEAAAGFKTLKPKNGAEAAH